MRIIKPHMKCSRLVSLLIACGALAHGDSVISFTGDLRTNGNVLACGTGCTLGSGNSDGDFAQWAAFVTPFTVSATTTMQAITFGYGGGVNGHGATILQGGFEPYLSLFDASGTLLASTFFGITCPPGAHTNSIGSLCFDVELDGGLLNPGTYQIAISAFENMSLAENNGFGTLSDGFTGLGNLAAGEDLHYAFDVVLGGTTSVPEPRTFSLLGAAALAICEFKKRQRS